MFKTIAIVLMAVVFVAANPEPKAKADPSVVSYSAPLVASPYVASPYVASPYVASPYVASPYVASPYVASAVYERTYHGNGNAFAYPYASAPYVASPYVAAASPYAAAYHYLR